MTATNTALLRACSLLLCFVAGSRQLSIEEFEVPYAVEIGSDAELRCQYELRTDETEDALYVKWWWTPASSSSDDRKQIYQRIAGLPAESIHHDNSSEIVIKDNDTIVLTKVTPVDSGTYECEVSNIEEIRQHGKLTVFYMGSGPFLNISQAKDSTDPEAEAVLLIECQADSVAPRPEVNVTINKREIDVTTFIEDEDHNGLYSVFANATVSTKDMAESEVRCEIYYSDVNITHASYVDQKTFVPAGSDTQSTTEMPEDATEPEATPESLQNSRDDGVQLHSSWVLLSIAATLTHLNTIL